MHTKSLRQLIQGLKDKAFSSYELTSHYLDRIEAHNNLNAFISIDKEKALNLAKSSDDLRQKSSQIKPLEGIPMAHKDIFCTDSLATTCASKMLANFIAPYEATVVQKLKDAGSIMLGKTNMDEFAMGSTNENSYFGPVKNPWNLLHSPGGSSGGSAAAVAAGLTPFATGTDTGGSIRQPAAFCGISGIKPTYGLISRFGMIAFASSLDQAGPMARSAEDLAFVLNEMVGFDEKDSTSVQKNTPNYLENLNKPIEKMKIAFPSAFLQNGVDEDIQKALHEAIKVYEALGAEIIELNLKHVDLWAPCYYVIACAEASSNLSRYDGIRFGYQSSKGKNLKEQISFTRVEGFGDEVKRRILTGTQVLSSGFFDAYYLQALKIRRLIKEELVASLEQADFILCPTTPTTAFKLGEKNDDPIQHYLADIFTVAANLAGLPALSIPIGFSQQGLPIGMQLIGKHFDEKRLLQSAHLYQQNTNWHLMKPQ